MNGYRTLYKIMKNFIISKGLIDEYRKYLIQTLFVNQETTEQVVKDK